MKKNNRPTRDENFKEISEVVSKLSKDISTKLGAVIVNSDNVIQSVGYNGFPRNVNDEIIERQERPLKYKWFEHAERNAIYNFARQFLKGSSIHLTWIPCTDCARGIIQTGISEVVISDIDVQERWKEDFLQSLIMLNESGVKVRLMNSNENIAKKLIKKLSQY